MLKPNRKTRWSCEPSESCLQRLLGKPCNYCYTLHPWNGASRRTGPPKLFQPFQPGSIALLPTEEKEFLKKVGLRFFSNCDYIASKEMLGYIKLATAEARTLQIPSKAITKNASLIDYHLDDFDIIHLSVDTINCGVNWKTATKYKQQHPAKVLIRAVCITIEDVKTFASWADIITPYHGPQIAPYPPKVVRDLCLEKYQHKTCTTCETCSLRCGLSQER
jgi:hypothetical protein